MKGIRSERKFFLSSRKMQSVDAPDERTYSGSVNAELQLGSKAYRRNIELRIEFWLKYKITILLIITHTFNNTPLSISLNYNYSLHNNFVVDLCVEIV